MNYVEQKGMRMTMTMTMMMMMMTMAMMMMMILTCIYQAAHDFLFSAVWPWMIFGVFFPINYLIDFSFFL
jgi:pheromone shutdown protein TraB